MSVNSKMTAIADAIRAKTGGTGLLTLDDMAQDIAAIDTSENLDEVLTEQESLIDQIQAALEDKGVKPEQTKTATPSLSQQTISPDSGKTLSEVTVEPITSSLLTSLDSDFKAENIANGVNMFGLIGTLAASAGMQVATGGIDIYTEFDADTEEISCAASVTGLAFEPKVVILISTEFFAEIFDDPRNVFVGAIEGVNNADEYWISHFLISNVNGNFYGNMTIMNLYGGDDIYDFSAGNIKNKPAWFSFTNKGFSISISESLDGSEYFNNSYLWYAFG